jgi:hypothetical protein
MANAAATASDSNVLLSPHGTKIVCGGASALSKSVEAASHFLQKNSNEHHISCREVRGHSYLAHSILSVYALRDSPAEIQRAFKDRIDLQQLITSKKHLAIKTLANPPELQVSIG